LGAADDQSGVPIDHSSSDGQRQRATLGGKVGIVGMSAGLPRGLRQPPIAIV
jgi:hypothetical protein